MKIAILKTPCLEDIIRLLNTFIAQSEIIPICDNEQDSVSCDILIAHASVPNPPTVFCKTIILNSDDNAIMPQIKLAQTQIITYGFNSRASVTVSGVSEDTLAICVRRGFTALRTGQEILPQELLIKSPFGPFKEQDECQTEALLCASTVCLAAGITPSF